MKINEKIRKTRKAKGLTMLELYQKLVEAFAEKALAYNSLARIEQGKTRPHINSLLQICMGLGVSLKELKEGTEEESTLVDIVKRNAGVDHYRYNEKAYLEILTPLKRGFLCTKLLIEPGGKTILEQDPIEKNKFEKFVYCLKGILTCHIGKETHVLTKGGCLSFESTLPHYFQNCTDTSVSCLVVQNPRHI